MPRNEDYLESLPMPRLVFGDSELLRGEFERMQANLAMEEVNFNLESIEDIVPEDENDLNSIKEANDKCNMISQYNNANLVNLELMQKYSVQAWKDYIDNVNHFKKQLEESNNEMKKNVEELNAKRKYEQMQTSDKIQDAKNKIQFMHYKNEQLEVECAKMENDIRSLQRKKMKTL